MNPIRRRPPLRGVIRGPQLRWLHEADESTRLLTRHPDLGRPGRVPGTREPVLPHFPYILPYRVKEQRVEILRVFHASRKWPEGFDR